MKRWFAFLFGWCVIASCLVFSIKQWAIHPNFYMKQYEKLDLAKQLDVSKEDLNRSITLLLEYLDGKQDSIDGQMIREGKQVSIFNSREKKHMVDVKRLYQGSLYVGYVSCILGCCIVFYFWKYHRFKALAYLTKGYLRAAFCFLVFVSFLALWMMTDFTDFWIRFHEVIFPMNDYWLLTPGIDFMIDMLPEEIFSSLVLRIVATNALFLIIGIACSYYYQRKKAPIGFELE